VGRQPRRDYPGAVHHVTSRGARQLPLFRDGFDYQRWLAMFAVIARRFDWLCLAYCLMPNHYHLIVVIPQGNLALGMHRLNLTYALAFNQRYETSGHAFDAPYGAELVQREPHFLEANRYVFLNPVRAGLCRRPEDWPTSSYRASLGLEPAPEFLDGTLLLRRFANHLPLARARLAAFVEDAI
jgi:putative transposase